MEGYDGGLNLKATELRLGLPGREDQEDARKGLLLLSSTTDQRNNNNKRSSQPVTTDDAGSKTTSEIKDEEEEEPIAPPAPKAQVVGWPPVRSYRKNSFQQQQAAVMKKEGGGESGMMIYVKVSMDGAPYLRKIDIKVYNGYPDLLKALETMFKMTIGDYSEREGYKGSEYAPTYEDKDGDWMLVGDVPWEMFMSTCKRMRIMKGSEIKGLGCVI